MSHKSAFRPQGSVSSAADASGEAYAPQKPLKLPAGYLQYYGIVPGKADKDTEPAGEASAQATQAVPAVEAQSKMADMGGGGGPQAPAPTQQGPGADKDKEEEEEGE